MFEQDSVQMVIQYGQKRYALHAGYLRQEYTHAVIILNIYCVAMARTVTRTSLSVADTSSACPVVLKKNMFVFLYCCLHRAVWNTCSSGPLSNQCCFSGA